MSTWDRLVGWLTSGSPISRRWRWRGGTRGATTGRIGAPRAAGCRFRARIARYALRGNLVKYEELLEPVGEDQPIK